VAAEPEPQRDPVPAPVQLTLDDLEDDDLDFGEWVESLPTHLEEAA
jgi:hypothetical protein